MVHSWVLAVFELTNPDDHRVRAAVEVTGGFRVECSCGWLSTLCPNGEVMFDVWQAHVITSTDV
jgi:hypothetical protein